MREEELDCKAEPSDLLYHLEHVLESDPQIDEVGFIHPLQLTMMGETTAIGTVNQSNEINEPAVRENNLCNSLYWSRDHKLGILANVRLPLYNAAKNAFMDSLERYKEHRISSNFSSDTFSDLETEVMKHSKALLIISSDFVTAWNARKLVLVKKQHLTIIMDEFYLSALVLSYSPKCESAWNHRRWVIKTIAGKSSNLQEIVEKESEFVKKLAEKSKMNFRAWSYRCWLVNYVSEKQVLHELNKSRDWTGLHVADSSSFHFRARLILRMLEGSWSEAELYKVWKEELDWDEKLINLFIGREALWLHRRFLSVFWIKHFSASGSADDVDTYLNNELQLFHSARIIPDNVFEDYQAQAMHSVTYIMWLMKHMSEYLGIRIQNKLQPEDLQMLVNNVCPEKSVLLDNVKTTI